MTDRTPDEITSDLVAAAKFARPTVFFNVYEGETDTYATPGVTVVVLSWDILNSDDAMRTLGVDGFTELIAQVSALPKDEFAQPQEHALVSLRERLAAAVQYEAIFGKPA